MAEKNLNEISRDARALFTRGMEALRGTTGLRHHAAEPGAGNGAGLFRLPQGAARRPVPQGRRRRHGLLQKNVEPRRLLAAGEAKAKMALNKNPAEAMAIAEQILNGDPNSSAAHRIIVDAGNALELPRTVAMSYETLVKNSPKDKDLAIEFAHAVSAIGEGSRAEKILMDLLREMPNDGDLKMALKDLSARKTMDEGGYGALDGGGGSYRDILKDKKEAVSLEQEKRVQKTEDVTERLIGEYEARLQTEPNNLKLIRSLAELYTQKKQFDRALKLYERVKSSEHGQRPVARSSHRRHRRQAVRLPDRAAQSLRAGPGRAGGENQGREARLPGGRMPEARGKIPHRPRHPLRDGRALFPDRQDWRGHPGIPEGAGQPLQAPRRDELPRPVLRQTQDVRPRRPHPPERHQGKARVRRREEGPHLQPRQPCFESMGKKEEAIEQFKQIYEIGRRLQGRRRQGGRLLRRAVKPRESRREPKSEDTINLAVNGIGSGLKTGPDGFKSDAWPISFNRRATRQPGDLSRAGLKSLARSIFALRAADIQLHRICDDLSGLLIFPMVVFSPWAFGTTEPWSVWTMNIAGFALGILLLVKLFIREIERIPPATLGKILRSFRRKTRRRHPWRDC